MTCGILNTKFGDVGYRVFEREGVTGAVLFEPYADKDGKPTWDYNLRDEKRGKWIPIVIRGVPYTLRIEMKYAGEWVITHSGMDRADEKRFEVSPSRSAWDAAREEISKAWIKYISQHQELLRQAKLESLNSQLDSLREKNQQFCREIAENNAKILKIIEEKSKWEERKP